MLAGNAFNYASVFFCWILFRKRDYLPKLYSLWAGLMASAVFFFFSTWDLWMPIARGASMSDDFAMGFVKITLYTNVVGLLSCMLGLAIGKQSQKKQ
jgi:ABC-type transporter Mla maintaining outer membrane lipid asymmetry permease subunit MlaE